MKYESTVFSNYQLIIDDRDTPVGVMINGGVAFQLNDKVLVTGDIRGYICPGIKQSGTGQIIEIRRDDTDHFFGVRMDNGEFGFLKSNRIQKI